jgi:hypothetical protein
MADPTLNQQESLRNRSRHRGQWILIDTGDEGHPRLLSIGADLYPGTSLRTGLDFVARRVVRPHILAVATSGTPFTSSAQVDERRWTVRVTPVLGVLTGRPVAVLACYDEADQDLPPPPLVGTWEWVITPPGPDQQLRTYWSPEMYQVYGIANPDRRWWDGPQWLDELIAVGDRPHLRALFETFVADTTPTLRTQTFTAAPPEGRRYALRVAGRRFEDSGRICLRGITARLHDQDVEVEPGHVEALLALSRDPLVMIDPRYEVIYLTTAQFGRLGLTMPDSRHLLKMCHEQDMARLRQMLRNATTNLGQLQPPIRVRFAGADSTWRELEVCGTGVQVTEQSLHVWCRLREPTAN